MIKLIKWWLKTVLLLTGILPLLKCNSGYKQKNGKVTFNGKEITDKNFVVLNEAFAKDSANAYYKEAEVTGADIASFTAIDNQFAKDKNYVYYCDEYRESQTYFTTKRKTITTVEKANPVTFVLIGNGYGKDSLHAFYKDQFFTVADVKSLTSINNTFVKDSVHAYFNMKAVKESDGKTFEVIDRNYAKDKAHVYFYGHNGEVKAGIYMLPCEVATFIVLEYPFSKDKTSVFYEDEKIPGAIAATFNALNYGFSKDSSAVFFETKKIAGADAESFALFKESDLYTKGIYYARDNTNVYWKQIKLNNVNTNEFKVMGQGYGSDNSHVFYETMVVKNADPKTFKVYPHGFGNADAEDANNKYNEGVKTTEE